MRRSILIIAPYGFHDRMPNFIEFVTARILAKEGWNVSALTRHEGNNPSRATVCGIEVHRYSRFTEGLLMVIHLLLKRPHIVHIHNLRNNRVGAVASIICAVFRIRFLFTEYGLPHDHYLSADRDDPFEKPLTYDSVIPSLRALITRCIKKPLQSRTSMLNYLFHWPLFHASTVIFVSKHNLPIAEKLGLKNYVLLPHVLDNERWNILAAASSEGAAPTMPQKPFVLFVGQIKGRKGWKTFVRAASLSKTPHAFVLATQSPNTDECTALIHALGLNEKVHVMHRIPNTTLRTLFSSCEMVIVPSLYEGFGLVPLEAFEAHKPLIATRVEALTDFLEHLKNAYLIPPKNPQALSDAIDSLQANHARIEAIVQGGEQTLTSLRSPEAHSAWLRMYESAIT